MTSARDGPYQHPKGSGMRLSRSQYLGRFASPAGPRFDVGMPEPPADARWLIATISKCLQITKPLMSGLRRMILRDTDADTTPSLYPPVASDRARRTLRCNRFGGPKLSGRL